MQLGGCDVGLSFHKYIQRRRYG